jgi:outer membrane lipoprotein-sorting protein
MKVKILLAMLALAMGFSASAQSLNAEFERELKAKNSGITSIHAEMTQTREVAVLADVVKKEGDFRFNEPCNILLSFDDGD